MLPKCISSGYECLSPQFYISSEEANSQTSIVAKAKSFITVGTSGIFVMSNQAEMSSLSQGFVFWLIISAHLTLFSSDPEAYFLHF